MIYTFYSFKGGVGRSMALANIAEVMCRRGLNVLMVDFDLEAPGLERYFETDNARYTPDVVASKRGIIDLLISYKNLRSLPSLPAPISSETTTETDASSAQDNSSFPVEPLSNFIVPIYEKRNGSGSQYGTASLNRRGALSIIPAGRRDGEEFARYAERVRGFGWDDFFANWDGERFFDWFATEATAAADVVLIDSRTGVTEMSGVCTYQLADVVVMFVAPNHQNLNGIHMMATSLSNPQLIEEGRQGRSLSQIFVPSRVESGEGQKLDEFADRYNQALGRLLPESLKFESSPFINLKIPYVPYYAFIEDVAVREPDKPKAADMVKAFENITAVLAQLALASDPLFKSYQEEEKKKTVSTEQLVRTAEDLYARFTAEEREMAQRVFVRLVRLALPSEGADDTRLPVNMKDFSSKAQTMVRLLAGPGLVVVEPGKQTGDEIVQLADEALIHQWERLEHWLEEDRDFLLWRQQIRANMVEWESRARPRDGMLKGVRLKLAKQWQMKRPDDLSDSEVFYINASEKDQKKRLLATTISALILAVTVGYLFYTGYKSYINEQKAQQRESAASKYNDLGNAAASKRDYNSAIASYTQVISLKPDFADAYFNRGIAYLNNGDNDLAIVDFNEAINLNPGFARAYLNRGIARINKGDDDQALADYNQALTLNPASVEAYLKRGLAFIKKGDADRAIGDFTEAIRLYPASAEAYLDRGNVFYQKGQKDAALADYTEAIRLNPDYAEALYSRGNYYLEGASYDNAVADYNAVIKGIPKDAIPRNARVYYNLGIAYIKKGDKKNAEGALNNALYTEDQDLYLDVKQKLQELGVSSVSQSQALVLLQYNNPDDLDTVNNIGNELRSKGYNVQSIQLTNGKTYGDVRYFFNDDRQNADNITQVVRNRLAKDGINLKMQRVYLGNIYKNAKPGTIEVWFPPLPTPDQSRTGDSKARGMKR